MLFGACSDILEETPKSIATETFYNTEQEVARCCECGIFSYTVKFIQ